MKTETKIDARGRGIDSPFFSMANEDESRQWEIDEAIASGEFFFWGTSKVGRELTTAWPGHFGSDEETVVYVAHDAPEAIVNALLAHEDINLVIELAR